MKTEKPYVLALVAVIGPNRELGANNNLLWHISEDLRHFKTLTMGHTIIMGRKTFESLGKPLPGRKNVVLSRSGLSLEQALAQEKEKIQEQPRYKAEVNVAGSAEAHAANSTEAHAADSAEAHAADSAEAHAADSTEVHAANSTEAHAADSAEAHAADSAEAHAADNAEVQALVFVVGGAEVYRQTMELADRLYITHVQAPLPEGGADVFFPEIDPMVWQETAREDQPRGATFPYPFSFVTYERRPK